jgi:transmembrane sensor
VNAQETSNPGEIKAEAAAWLQRRDFGEWTENDAAELEAWLAQSHLHAAAYWRLEAAWEQTYRLSVLRRADAEPARAPGWFTLPMMMRTAAVLVAAAVLGAGAIIALEMPRDRTYATGIGGHEVVKFADGSQIELNTDTVLRAHMTTQERTIWLDRGEAFFRVKHDSAHPLVVIAGKQRITDLGTQFLVRREGSELKVALLEGRVRFGTTNLMPGDEAVATANSVVVSKRSVEELTNEIAWRNGVLVFRHATLAEAVKAFNRYSDRKMVVPDPAVGRRTVGGTFRTNDVEGFTAVVQDLLGLRVANEGNQIVIGR